MNDQIAALIDRWSDVLVSGAIVFLRVGSFMALVPGFGERSVPVRVKLGLAIAFTCVVAPAVAESLPDAPASLVTGALLLLQETMIGLALGLVVCCGLLAVEMAGNWAAQSSSLSQMFGVAGEPMPAMSHLFVAAALALAMIGGLHVKLAAALILSYEAVPAGRFIPAALMRDCRESSLSAAALRTNDLIVALEREGEVGAALGRDEAVDLVDDDGLDTGVVELMGQFAWRVERIDVHLGGASAHDAVHGNGEGEDIRAHQRDSVAALDAKLLLQPGCDGVR